MFAGHFGVALVIGRVEPRINLGALVAAALWLDVVLWLLILVGWESVRLPADFAATHQPEFVFPYSHGLLAAALWSLLAAAAALLRHRRGQPPDWRAAGWVGAAVFSHWLLDALVHRPELPLAGAASAQLGLGLWDHLAAALAVEAALVGLGLVAFLPGSGLSRAARVGLALLAGTMLALTIAGMTVAPPPPSAAAMAASSLVVIALVAGLAAWFGRRRLA